jgi:hypothetical protein
VAEKVNDDAGKSNEGGDPAYEINDIQNSMTFGSAEQSRENDYRDTGKN